MKIDNSPVRGTRDLLPAAVADREQVLTLISGVYRRYGYQRIEKPCLEDIGRLVSREARENEKLIYHVLLRGLDETVPTGTAVSDLADLGLRFDLTVPLSRFYGHNHAALPVPFRSLQIGSVWRAERPQKGRYWQFTQCDVDLIGENSVLAEAELIEATADALAAVGLDSATIRLSDRRFLCALAGGVGLGPSSWPAFFIGLGKLDKIGREGVRAELGSRGMPAGPVDAALEKIASLQGLPAAAVPDRLAESAPAMADSVIADLATTFACLDRLADGRTLGWAFDPSLVRGMGYYTGQIFEISHPATSSSIAGGGRHDRLIGQSLNRDVPACGFSIGFERIMDLLGRVARSEAVALLFDSEVPLPEALRIGRDLRADGRAISAIRRTGQLGKQLARLEE